MCFNGLVTSINLTKILELVEPDILSSFRSKQFVLSKQYFTVLLFPWWAFIYSCVNFVPVFRVILSESVFVTVK